MHVLGWRTIALAVALAFAFPAVSSSESPDRIFAKSWEGKSVIVITPLYTLVYNERGKLGQTYNGRRDGLTVVTPSKGFYLQFDGRQGRDDVMDADPVKLFDAVNAAYESDSLELRSYRKVEPVVINRYDRGVELVVTNVKVDRDTVRIDFGQTGRAELATGLTIKWPIPLSKGFTERELVEGLIRRFVDDKAAEPRH